MQFQYIPYIWPLTISAIITLSLAIYSLFRQRHAKGAKAFILCMLAVTIWSYGNALEMSATDLPTKLFWANFQYIAYTFAPVTLFIIALQFTGYDHWIRNKRFFWITVLPAIIVILVWTDGWHGLVRYNVHLDNSGAFPVIAKEYGPAFFVHAAYAHFLNLAAWVLLARAAFIKNNVYRKQAMAILVGVSLVVIPNVLYILGYSPVTRFDITPVFFGPSGLVIAWGIFRYKLFDVIPVARATVIETMNAGVMVLDLQNRVLDINPAFEKIVSFSASKASTKTVEEVCGDIPQLLKVCTDPSITHQEFSINANGSPKIYEVLISPLTDNKGELIGRLIVTYDITEKKQAQQEYMKQQWKIAVTEERERLGRDMHDNLGQVLGFINLQAQGIRQELSNDGVGITLSKLDKLVEVTQAAHQEIREFIRKSRSPVSMDKDYKSTLLKDIKEFEEQTGLSVDLDIPREFTGEGLELSVRLNLLNILKEALTNIRKHAEADRVKIVFSLSEKRLDVMVEDNGKGFEIYRHNHGGVKGKYGLDIMRERVSIMDAEISIQSIKGKGSRIYISIPWDKGKEESKNEITAG